MLKQNGAFAHTRVEELLYEQKKCMRDEKSGSMRLSTFNVRRLFCTRKISFFFMQNKDAKRRLKLKRASC